MIVITIIALLATAAVCLVPVSLEARVVTTTIGAMVVPMTTAEMRQPGILLPWTVQVPATVELASVVLLLLAVIWSMWTILRDIRP